MYTLSIEDDMMNSMQVEHNFQVRKLLTKEVN
jgi:hypothetical protein